MIVYVWVEETKINGIYSRKFNDNQVELDLNEEQFAYLQKNVLGAYFINSKLVYKNLEKIKLKQELEKEQADILQWLADNDWKVNKIIVGEWLKDDPRWLQYLNDRSIKRLRLDEIKELENTL